MALKEDKEFFPILKEERKMSEKLKTIVCIIGATLMEALLLFESLYLFFDKENSGFGVAGLIICALLAVPLVRSVANCEEIFPKADPEPAAPVKPVLRRVW